MSYPWKVLVNSETNMDEPISTYGSTRSDTNQRLVIPRQCFTKELENQHHERVKRNLSNVVKTTKYSIWNFLPKNLFEQFHRFANIYFLLIAVLNWVPAVKAFAKEITMIPLLFVLSVTLVKDLYEDQRRRRSDAQVNNSECFVYERNINKYIKSKWKDVQTGDIIKLCNNEIIPADILLLQSSDPNDICYLETANLDGETNLKQREVVKSLNQGQDTFSPGHFSSFIHCEEPNNKIYQFRGYIATDERQFPIGKNNLLLRGCVIRNTGYVEGIVVYAGHDTKAMRNNSGPRSKRSKLERDMNKDVIACVVILFVLCLIGAIGCGFWTNDNKVFDHQYSPELDLDNENVIQRSPAEEGFVRFWTYIIIFQVLIPISLYVSVEIVKLGQCFFISNDLEMYYAEKDQPAICRALNINEDLGQIEYVFSDKTGTLTENIMVFRRCTIAGEDFAHKTIPLLGDQDQKQSTTIETQSQGSVLDETHLTDGPRDSDLAHRITQESCTNSEPNEISSVNEFFTLLAICNTVVVSYKQQHDNHVSLQSGEISVDGKTNDLYLNGRKSTNALPTSDEFNEHNLTYEAESPDEAALVKSASMYGYKLVSRSPDSVTIEVPGGGAVKYHLLHVLVFDSTRRRMSVIVRRENDHKIVMYCKGADTAILPQLSKASKRQTLRGETSSDKIDGEKNDGNMDDSLMEITETHLNLYAREGLRTLCMARKELSQEEYQNWLVEHEKAEISLHNREELLQSSYCKIEREMELLGATGIEDRLQEGVPEAIANLRAAGLKVWVLTGDKQETAVNIAHSCNLLDFEMHKITLNASSKESCAEQIEAWIEKINNSAVPVPSQQSKQKTYGLIIDGQTIQYALEKPLDMEFLELAKACQVVVCCRVSPVQKASVVGLVREQLQVMTLAIGDGANDVSMIQVADIGVGISGQEGMQAVQASDFAIGRFRFLARLLLVHGHWCYDRIAKVILYFFYKNMMFVMVLFWFQLYNGFSGSNAINELNLIFFNLVFTALPPIISGIWDQDVSCETLLEKPDLYKQGQESKLYSRKLFWIAISDAFFQSIIIFFSSVLFYNDTDGDLFTVGIMLHQCAVIVASLYIAIETGHWTVIHAVVLGISVLLSFLWCIVYSVFSPTLPDYYVAIVTMGSPEFWLLCLLATIVSLLPRFLARTVQQSLWPTEIQKARVVEVEPVSLVSYQATAPTSSSENNRRSETSGVTV